jgi:trehalose 6-phosphate phosphatase
MQTHRAYLFHHLDSVEALVARPRCGLFTDIDGTISQIAPSPQEARVSATCRGSLSLLAKHLALVAVVSGRPVMEMRRMMGVEGLIYIGNHGMERWLGHGVELWPGSEEYPIKISQALDELTELLSIEGIAIENKGVTASIHYRLCPKPELAREAILAAIARSAAASELRVREGRKIVDIGPPIEADKGIAVLDLVQRYRLTGAIYLGDDLTDVDAFIALRRGVKGRPFKGLSIGVIAEEATPQVVSQANFTLNGVADVERFLTWLLEVVSGSKP